MQSHYDNRSAHRTGLVRRGAPHRGGAACRPESLPVGARRARSRLDPAASCLCGGGSGSLGRASSHNKGTHRYVQLSGTTVTTTHDGRASVVEDGSYTRAANRWWLTNPVSILDVVYQSFIPVNLRNAYWCLCVVDPATHQWRPVGTARPTARPSPYRQYFPRRRPRPRPSLTWFALRRGTTARVTTHALDGYACPARRRG